MRVIGLLLFLGVSLHLGAQTTFTYQGHLKDGTNLANGSFDFRFTLFGGGAGGIELAPSQLTTPIAVADGNFNAALDFGNVFDGGARWLEIGVKPSGSFEPFEVLSPRQRITPTPEALHAAKSDAAGIIGIIAPAQLPPDLAWLPPSGLLSVSQGGTGTNDARYVGRNVGLFQMSPPWGNSGYEDMSNATPAFIGQQGISWWGNKIPFEWTATGTTLGAWTGKHNFPDICSFGSHVMAPNYSGDEFEFHINRNPFNRDPLNHRFSADATARFFNWAPTRTSGIFVAKLSWDGNDTYIGDAADNSYLAFGVGGPLAGEGEATRGMGLIAMNGPFAFTSPYGVQGDDPSNANHQLMVIDPITKRITIPRMVANVGSYTNATNQNMVIFDQNDGEVWMTNAPVHVAALLQVSDRNKKQNLRPIDSSAILASVAGMPLSRWNYLGQGADHLGPMAQDFRSAFGLGSDDKSIATIDGEGVALAAIQGLNLKVDALAIELKWRNGVILGLATIMLAAFILPRRLTHRD
jgi:hypothetical protein